jgi:hypothetical protein
LRPAAAGLEGSAAHTAPQRKQTTSGIAQERDGRASPRQRAQRQGAKPEGRDEA